MKPIKRAVHIDFHTMPGIPDMAKDYTGEEIAEMLAKAHVDYVNIFARCNIGFSYYPTKIGTMYPGLKKDLFGETLKALQKRGIQVTAYCNAGLNHELLLHNHGFCRVNAQNQIYEGDPVTRNTFRIPCFNTPYRDYLKAEIQEILAYKPDGIFLDMFLPKPCYCPACVQKMKARGIDYTNDDAVFAFTVETYYEVFEELRELIPKNIRTFFNSFPFDPIHTKLSHAELECLPTSIWGYDFLPCQAPYQRKLAEGKDLLYMTGRMVSGWGDFAGNKSRAALETDVFDALMYGFVPSVGDMMHPTTGLDKALYRDVTEIYEWVEKLEKWTYPSKAKTDVAVLRNILTLNDVRKPVKPSDKGVARMLSEMKIQYDIINEEMDFEPYRLLILPDHIRITPELQKKLASFKGSILSTGKSIAKGKPWSYITSFENDTATDPFYEYGGEWLGGKFAGVKMKTKYSIAPYVKAFCDRHFDGEHGYFYAPPQGLTEYSAVAMKGKCAHIGFNIFEAYMEFGALFHRRLVEDLFKALLPDPILTTNLPATSRATLLEGKNGDLLMIKTSIPEHWAKRGVINEHTPLPAGYEVSVEGEYKAVSIIPEKVKVESRIENGRTIITLPEILGYCPFLLEK